MKESAASGMYYIPPPVLSILDKIDLPSSDVMYYIEPPIKVKLGQSITGVSV